MILFTGLWSINLLTTSSQESTKDMRETKAEKQSKFVEPIICAICICI